MRGIAMKWIEAAAVVAIAVAVVGCARTAAPVHDPSKFVVLGSENATQAAVTTPMPGLDANSVPQDAIKGVPGASDVVVASGTPAVSRDRAIEMSQPRTGKLVSAVYVLLPRKFMTAVLNNPKKAKPTTAWIVTWTGVREVPASGGGQAIVKGGNSGPRSTGVGDTTAVIDATTGEQLLLTEYATPHTPTGQGATSAGVNP